DLDYDLVHFVEIGAMGAAAAPDVHAAVDEQFHSTLVHARNAGIAEQENAHIVEEREIGDGDSVGRRNLGGVTAARGQAHEILVARDRFQCNPALRGQEVEDAGQAGAIRGDGVEVHGALRELSQN